MAHVTMFEGFTDELVDVDGMRLHVRRAGTGSPVLLLHGYPETHLCWHAVAPALVAAGHTVVVPDLRGYGASDSATPDEPGAYRKRVMAAEQVRLMAELGHERFAVVGHDRGARVGYRIALDHPGHVDRLAVLDVIPTVEQFEHPPARGVGIFHWYLLAQPAPLPEQLIAASRDVFLDTVMASWTGRAGSIPPQVMDAYRAAFTDRVLRATCNDYRAGATLDCDDDEADRRAGRTIDCPLLVLWGARRKGDHLATWRRWATDVRGSGIDCGHFLPEEAPDEVVAELVPFLGGS